MPSVERRHPQLLPTSEGRYSPCCGKLLDLLWFVGKFELTVCNDLNETRDESGPTCLMTCANPGAVVVMEIFVEQNQITPVRIVLEYLATPIDGPVRFNIVAPRMQLMAYC